MARKNDHGAVSRRKWKRVFALLWMCDDFDDSRDVHFVADDNAVGFEQLIPAQATIRTILPIALKPARLFL